MMKTKIAVWLAVLLLSGYWLFAQGAGDFGTPQKMQPPHRVVMELTSGDTVLWHGIMNNIRNLRKAWGDSIAIEVVVHGPAIDLLVMSKTTQLSSIQALTNEGVHFFGCENSIRARNIDKATMLKEIGFVPSGVGEVILKQEQGWSYLKISF